MKNVSKYKVDKFILIPMFLFVIISLLTIHSSQKLLPSFMNNLYIKQLLWYVLGFIIAYFIMFIGNNYIYRNIWFIYIIGVLSLLGLLLFAEPINDARCWFTIPGIGTIQPSEFMKIILIITLAKMVNKFNDDFANPTVKEEFIFLLKIATIVFIPSILTFLQPDTGVVLIYLIITIVMLFISGIRYRWFAILFGSLAILIGFVLLVYFINTDMFINLFGTNFFLRVDRLLDWSSKTGYQLENGLSAIGAGGFFGNGLGNTPIYFPEPQTDFIFAVYANNFGFIGSIFLIGLIIFFDTYLISVAINTNKNINKYVIAGIVGMLLYQQIQNIGMTFGLLPITGITLPFISYGGSSLLSYMLMAGIIFNISNESFRYTN
ncbi:MAG TPA: FtsW/RodA/SpoVE family cell cycle protein [Mollicutes bacterium]|jgi:rod shape determining protein RodA|nr:FtsW/RodA/SpoVE family cell cycle protein [Mollicutes bacterium]